MPTHMSLPSTSGGEPPVAAGDLAKDALFDGAEPADGGPITGTIADTAGALSFSLQRFTLGEAAGDLAGAAAFRLGVAGSNQTNVFDLVAALDDGVFDTLFDSLEITGIPSEIDEVPVFLRYTGGGGADAVTGGSNADAILGAGGEDTLIGGGGDDCLDGGGDADSIDGGDGDDVVRGRQGDDTVSGSLGDDHLRAGNDRDLVFGGFGNDTVNGENGDDTLFGEQGNDSLRGGAGDDDLRAGDGQDVVFGGFGDDAVNGENGDDTLVGGQGNDSLRGGEGADVYAYEGEGMDFLGTDTILDFAAFDGDSIDLSGLTELDVIEVIRVTENRGSLNLYSDNGTADDRGDDILLGRINVNGESASNILDNDSSFGGAGAFVHIAGGVLVDFTDPVRVPEFPDVVIP